MSSAIRSACAASLSNPVGRLLRWANFGPPNSGTYRDDAGASLRARRRGGPTSAFGHLGGKAANLQKAGSAEVEGEFRCRISAGQGKSARASSLRSSPNNGSRKRSRCGSYRIRHPWWCDRRRNRCLPRPGAYADSAVDSGKLRFRPRKLPRRYRKSHCNQPLEPILAAPADSGNRAPFSTVGSGPAVELSRMPDIAKFGISGMLILLIKKQPLCYTVFR